MCRSGRGGPRTLSRTTDSNLDCAFVETALVFLVPKIGWVRAPLGPLVCPPAFALATSLYVIKDQSFTFLDHKRFGYMYAGGSPGPSKSLEQGKTSSFSTNALSRFVSVVQVSWDLCA